MTRVCTVVFIVIFLSSCSWSTRFAISNKSKEAIYITYSVNTFEHTKTKEIVCPIVIDEWNLPNITSDRLSWFNTGNWTILPKEKYKLNAIDCVLELQLNTGESVGITNKSNYTGHQSRYGKEKLNLGYLKISSEGGSIQLKGWDLLRKFKKIRSTLYVYKFK